MTAFFKRYAKTLLVIAGVILFYEIFTDIGGILNSVVFPGLSEVLPAFGKALPELFYGLWCSLQKLVPAFVLALVIGIGVGLPVGQSEELRKMLGPIFNGLASVPATLLTTYAITVFPTFQGASIFIIFLGCLWPILNGTISGVTLIEKSYINSARILELKGFTLTAKVILPGTMPADQIGRASCRERV